MAVDSDTVPSDFPEDADELIVQGAALYIVGWRMVPKFRFDEAEFHRELSQVAPPNNDVAAVKDMHDNWFRRARETAAKRPMMNSPQVVWRGTSN